MNHELLAMLDYIEQERGISRDQLIGALEKALQTAGRKGVLHPASELEVKIDRKNGDIRAWANLTVVDTKEACIDEITLEEARATKKDAVPGDVLHLEVSPKEFGRIAAQTAKQTIFQQIHQAEKETVQDEFQTKVGEIINGTVRRFDSGSIIVDLQRAEGIISSRDKVPGEQYMPGDRINALLVKVDTMASGPSLILSRASTGFIRKLFEREVSEIHDGIVEVVSVAREAGSRTKVAVRSGDARIDPVGACVGMRGMRVKNIIGELGGERIDIIHYADDVREYVANALHPAKAERIEVDEAEHAVTFHVNEENSRLAYGKKMQNVRLAQKLTGWRIDINVLDAEQAAETASFEEQKMLRIKELSALFDISIASAEVLVENGFLSLEGLKELSVSELRSIEGLTAGDVEHILSKTQA